MRRRVILASVAVFANLVITRVIEADEKVSSRNEGNLKRLGFGIVTIDRYNQMCSRLGSNFEMASERWRQVSVSAEQDELSIQIGKIVPRRLESWSPPEVDFSVDLSHINKIFERPTQMMSVGDGWLCVYAYGEFGNGIWFWSNRTKEMTKVTDREVVSIEKIEGRVFLTTIDDRLRDEFFELKVSPKIEMRLLFETRFSSGIRIIKGDQKGLLYLVGERLLVRWDLTLEHYLVFGFVGGDLAWIANDVSSVCESDGDIWMGGSGHVFRIRGGLYKANLEVYAADFVK